MENKTPEKIVTFLRGLADQIEARTLPEKDLFEVTEFYMKCLFLNQSEETPEEEMLRFLSLGWYIYKNMIDT